MAGTIPPNVYGVGQFGQLGAAAPAAAAGGGGFLAAVGTALPWIGLGVGVSYILQSIARGPQIRRYQQKFRPQFNPYGALQVDPGPWRYMYGLPRRTTPQWIYVSRTLVQEDQRFGARTIPVTHKHLHIVMPYSRGRTDQPLGVYVNDRFYAVEDGNPRPGASPVIERDDGGHLVYGDEVPDNDGSTMFDLPGIDGRAWIYDLADGQQMVALRRATVGHRAQVEGMGFVDLEWTDEHKCEGWSLMYLRFIARPRMEPDEEGDINIEPEPGLGSDGWPEIDIVTPGRHILRPNSPDPSEWDEAWTPSWAAVTRDFLAENARPQIKNFDTQALRDSHVVSEGLVSVELPPDLTDPDTGVFQGRLYITLHDSLTTPPPKPTTFIPPDRWKEEVPVTIPEGMYRWSSYRTGTSSEFKWSDPVLFKLNVEGPGDLGDVGGFSTVGGMTTFSPTSPNTRQSIPHGSTALPRPLRPDGGLDTVVGTSTYRDQISDQMTTYRYPVSAEITSDDDVYDVLSKLAICGQGNVVERGGTVYIMAGWNRPVIGDLRHGTGEIVDATPSNTSESYNAVSMSLAQSETADYREHDVLEVVDQDRVDREGEKRVLKLGTHPYITQEMVARRLMVNILNQLRYTRRWSRIGQPGQDWEFATAPPHSAVTLDNEFFGAEIRTPQGMRPVRGIIEGVSYQEDAVTPLQIRELPDNAFIDALSLPALDPDITDPRFRVTAPTNFDVGETNRPGRGGDVLYFTASWDPVTYPRTEIRWRPIVPPEGLTIQINGVETTLTTTPTWDDAFYLTVDGGISRVVFGGGSIIIDNEYQFQARHHSLGRYRSDWVDARLRPGGDTVSPDRVRDIGIRNFSNGIGFQATWVNPREEDYKETWLWLTKGEDPRPNLNVDPPTDIVSGPVWTYLFTTAPRSIQEWVLTVVHFDTSDNESLVEAVEFRTFPADLEFLIYDLAYTYTKTSDPPDDLDDDVEFDDELTVAGATRFAYETPDGEYGWGCYANLYAGDAGDFGDVQRGGWTNWIPWSVPIGSDLTIGDFNDQVDIEGRYLDGLGGEEVGDRWDGTAGTRQAFIDGMTPSQPVIQLRRRKKKGAAEQFVGWSEAFRHRWVTFGLLTPDGPVLGHIANLVTSVVSPDSPPPPRMVPVPDSAMTAYALISGRIVPGKPSTYAPSSPWSFTDPRPITRTSSEQRFYSCERTGTANSFSWGSVTHLDTILPLAEARTAWALTTSSTPPSVPTNYGVSSPWSFTRPTNISAIASTQYLYSTTRTGSSTNFNWSDPGLERTIAAVGSRTETVYAESAGAAPSIANTSAGVVPSGWSTTAASPYPTLANEYVATRRVTGARVGSWTVNRNAIRTSITIYQNGSRSAAPRVSVAGSATSAPVVPGGWSTDASATRPTSSSRSQFAAVITGNGSSATVTSSPSVIAVWDAGTTFNILASRRPAKPTSWNPGTGWSSNDLTATRTMNVYSATRVGWYTLSSSGGQPSAHTPASSAWSSVTLTKEFVDTTARYNAQYVYALSINRDTQPKLPPNTGRASDAMANAGPGGTWQAVPPATDRGRRALWGIGREPHADVSRRWRNWGIGTGNALTLIAYYELQGVYTSFGVNDNDITVLAPGGSGAGQQVKYTRRGSTRVITASARWSSSRPRGGYWVSTRSRQYDVASKSGTWTSWSAPSRGGGGMIIRPPGPPEF